jgi:L-histidine N-alpha-methyltransferase
VSAAWCDPVVPDGLAPRRVRAPEPVNQALDLSPAFLRIAGVGESDPAAEVEAGLLKPTAVLSPKFLYDKLGSALFSAITELPEYYPTRTESAILERCLPEIAAALAPGLTLIDLGAGDCTKASHLLGPLQVSRYLAIDISETHLRGSVTALQARFASLPMTGVAMDFARGLALPEGLVEGPALVFYPGSSIGNFAPAEAFELLRQAHQLSRGGALLIGADLLKPVEILQAAYDDAIGVTSAFNLNLLTHVNRILGSDFQVTDWRHRCVFNASESRIEMHLEARRELLVRWPGRQRAFATGERIHTESSYKWTAAGFQSLLRDAGWRQVRRWTDSREWFGVFLARA